MAQQLLCESSGEVIQIPEGETFVGRGALLKVKDKRVSRNHALITLKDEKLFICPKHINPCFYKPGDEASYIRLVKDQSQELHCGDSFSLLPEGELAFKVVSKEGTSPSTLSVDQVTSINPPKSNTDPSTRTNASDISNIDHTAHSNPLVDDLLFGDLSPSERTTKKIVIKESSQEELKDTKLLSVNEAAAKNGKDSLVSTETSTSSSCMKDSESSSLPPKLAKACSSSGKSRVLPGWLSSVSMAEKPLTGKVAPGQSKTLVRKDDSVTRKRKLESGSLDESSFPPAKKPPPSSKKAKVSGKAAAAASSKAEEMSADKDSGTVSKISSKAVAAASSKAEEMSADKDSGTVSEISSKAAASSTAEEMSAKATDKDSGTKKRPSCPYGTKCYRKNPDHFRDYSHDFAAESSSEEDEGEGKEAEGEGKEAKSDKPVCPYGGRCYRKNPAHRREYFHPTDEGVATRTRPRRNRTSAKDKKSVVVGDSDDDGQPNTYDYQDSFIDDNITSGTSSNYSMASDSDSDWVVPTGEKGGRDEDVDELIAEADEFISNRKMRK